MDQEYFYVEMPSGTVVSYTTEKAAASAAAAYDGKIVRGSKRNPVVAGTAPATPEDGLIPGPDTTAAPEGAEAPVAADA